METEEKWIGIDEDAIDNVELEEDLNQNALDTLEEAQKRNEAILNIPRTLEFGGKTFTIKSKPLYWLGQIDKAIFELNKILAMYQSSSEDYEDEGAYWDDKIKVLDGYYKKIANVIFLIVNVNPEEPVIDEEWIFKNLPAGEADSEDPDGDFCQRIVDIYNEKCAANGLVKKILLSRKL